MKLSVSLIVFVKKGLSKDKMIIIKILTFLVLVVLTKANKVRNLS